MLFRSIGRKQSTDNSVWLDAAARIEELVSRDELDAATAAALAEIRAVTDGKKAAYAWSGGKDSLVIAQMCRDLGITDSVFVHTELEYPVFLTWCLENKPEGCEVINTGQNLDWLCKHPVMLFPDKSPVISRWFEIVQRTGIRRYFNAHNLDIIVAGHRKADGNFVGRGSNILSNSAGVVRYSPLADWPHELVLAYIHYHSIPLPPIYSWKDGYRCGTHPWPSRMGMKTIADGWADVYDIDPSIVVQAAAKIDSAARFLEEVRA